MKGASTIFRILSILAVIGVMHIYNQNAHNNKLTDWFATAPDDHLNMARKAASDNAIGKCLKEIDIAIEEMKAIEVFSDSVSQQLIEQSIEDLEILESHIANHELNVNELNLVFAKGINSLAYTYLSITEDELRHHHEIKAVHSLKIVIDHLYNSMSYLNKKNVEEEKLLIKHIYSVIDSIERHDDFDFHSIDLLFEEIEALIADEEKKLQEERGETAH